MPDMIRAQGLVKRYKSVEALRGLDLAVPEGSVLALLGPNGAGKTTAVRCLTTLLTPDEGSAEVAGVDVLRDPEGVRRKIGLSGQYAAVDEHLTGFENLTMVGRLYGMPKARARERARELLDRFALSDAGDRPSKTYSGGMRRRLDLAGALVAAPPVLVLDEPTTGLDVRARQQMWDVIKELVSGGATLLLTTQYLEEADKLADSIVVIDHGEAIARGTADELKSQTGGTRLEVVVAEAGDVDRVRSLVAAVAAGDVQADERTLTATVDDGPGALHRLLDDLRTERLGVLEVGLRRPTLDDVFLALTGRATADDSDDTDAPTDDQGRSGLAKNSTEVPA